eukprot:m.1391917 g.1391917  ORF g.1391917 m.1391917 type:complete len:96 (+) comp24991_c0_seq46:3208-3495(+)
METQIRMTKIVHQNEQNVRLGCIHLTMPTTAAQENKHEHDCSSYQRHRDTNWVHPALLLLTHQRNYFTGRLSVGGHLWCSGVFSDLVMNCFSKTT